MESFFNTNIKPHVETDNIIYNIINIDEPQYLFLFFLITIGFIYISTKILYNINILIGIIFASIMIYYIYTDRKYNKRTDNQLKIEKFESIATKNRILAKYPDIVDFLYYFENYKKFSILKYQDLVSNFESFCQIYEYCLIDNKNIFTNYDILKDIKITICNIINSFIFNSYQIEYENIGIKHKIAAEELLDKMLNKLVLLYNKYNYYNGLNVNNNLISYEKVLPYNIAYDSNYREHYEPFNMANLLFF